MNRRKHFDFAIRKRKYRLGARTLVMAVVNVTPDSFSDGGLYLEPERAIEHGLELARQGADWIDVGGESTRPGAKPISADDELRRILLVIQGLRWKLPSLPISIDTMKSKVAEEAVRAGADIINDVSGLSFDPGLADVARRHHTVLILTHMRHRPENMQKKSFARSIRRSLENGIGRSIRRALAAGVPRSKLVIDPGLGFGKSRRQNYEILAHLEWLRRFQLPILSGTSRKSFVRAVLTEGAGNTKKSDLLKKSRGLPDIQSGDAAAVAASILGGAHIVRIHDVQGLLPAVRFADALLETLK